jgi:1-acyl-sn-glycerol-3-phosphate acyltransferase
MLVDFLQQSANPLFVSQQFLSTLGTQISVSGQDNLPTDTAVLVVSNHRSFMDVAVLMNALNLPIHFACHHYMGQVPIFGDMVTQLGFLPLDEPKQRYNTFFNRASLLLQNHEAIGIFPEGTKPMVESTSPRSIGEFQRGFAHLALRAPVENLIVLPVAIAARHELNTNLFPVRWLQLFDPAEPLFDRPDWHPLVLYHQVQVSIGKPIRITSTQKQDYHGKKALTWVKELTGHCQQEIRSLLRAAL